MRDQRASPEHGARGRRQAAVALFALAILLQAGAVQGQETDLGAADRRVRIETKAESKPRTGVLVGATADTLTIRVDRSGVLAEVSRADVVDLRVSRGVRRETLCGLLAGAAAWVVIVGIEAAIDTLDESGVGEPAFIGGLLVGGAAIGSLVKRERWERVSERSLALWLTPERRGATIRLAVRF
jgi:hypothetical protein